MHEFAYTVKRCGARLQSLLAIQEHSMSAPATSQPLRSNPASNLVPEPVIASAEPSAAAEPLLTLLLENEDTAAYEEIFARISAVVKPADFLEEIWVRDVVALVWEAFRLRRLKTCLLETAAPRGLARVFSSLLPHAPVNEIAPRWARRDGERGKQVSGLLASTPFTPAHIPPHT